MFLFILFLLTPLLLASPATAFFDAGLEKTLGSQHYNNTYGYADFGGQWHLKPMFNVYHSDVSSGTVKTFSARIGYDESFWGMGMTAGFTPKISGYSNSFFGVDGIVSFIPSGGSARRLAGAQSKDVGPRGRGLARIDVGASMLHTNHRDEFQSTRTSGIFRRPAAIRIAQTDFTATAGVSFLDTTLSAEATKSVYSRNLADINARPGLNLLVPGLDSIIQGFPDTSTHVRLDWGMIPVVTPYFSYTLTHFKLGAAPSKAYTAGIKVGLEIIQINGSFEHYVQSGTPDSNYISLGVGVRL